MDLLDFEGKRYVVTGASSGIGRCTAIELSKRGGVVVLVGRNKDALQETYGQMQGEGHVIVPMDLTQAELPLDELMVAACADNKKLDGLVYSAGIASFYPLNSITRARIDACMSVNTYSFIELVKCITKRKYRADTMSIVAVSSLNAIQPMKCQTLYAMSKAALNSAAQTLAMELADKGIRVNSICPGSTKTRMMEEAIKRGDGVELDRQLLGMLTPVQIANAILFLLSDMSSAITGRTLLADGGRFL